MNPKYRLFLQQFGKIKRRVEALKVRVGAIGRGCVFKRDPEISNPVADHTCMVVCNKSVSKTGSGEPAQETAGLSFLPGSTNQQRLSYKTFALLTGRASVLVKIYSTGTVRKLREKGEG